MTTNRSNAQHVHVSPLCTLYVYIHTE